MSWWQCVELFKQLTLEAINQLFSPYGAGLTLCAYIIIQFIHVSAILTFSPHLHHGEAVLEEALLATAVITIAVASVYATHSETRSNIEERVASALGYFIDLTILVCMYITVTICRGNVIKTVHRDRLVARMSQLSQECEQSKKGGRPPLAPRFSFRKSASLKNLSPPSTKGALANIRKSITSIVGRNGSDDKRSSVSSSVAAPSFRRDARGDARGARLVPRTIADVRRV